MNQKDITVNANSDIGTALNIKASNGKYHYFLAVENTGATGAAPEQLEVNVVGALNRVYVAGKKDSPAKELTVYGTRDTFRYLESIKGQTIDFLQTNPDGCGFTFSGTVDYWQNDVTSGSIITAVLYITVTKAHEFVDNTYDLVSPLAYIDSSVPANIVITGTGTQKLTLATFPADGTIVAKSETESIATVSVSGNEITVTGVATGNAIIELEVTAAEHASRKQTLVAMVI